MKISELDTPAVVVDLDIVGRNIARAQHLLDGVGIALRPHIKTHKLPDMARRQIDAGAQGIACQKVSEAEVFADAGCSDILLCYNILGAEKLARLLRLARRVEIAVVADSVKVVEGLSETFAGEDKPLSVLVECDTGLKRCGVQSPEAARDLAVIIHRSRGLHFDGLMTYPAPGMHEAVQAFLSEAKQLCIDAVGHCDRISSGGTPSMADAGLAPIATEYRPGTYIYNDRSLVERGACTWSDCALTVLARVVSRPTPDRAIIDAGSKSLTSDLLGLTGYGAVMEYPQAVISGLSEEHGHIDLSVCGSKPAVGELVRIVPNHVCPVTNLVDVIHTHRHGEIIESLPLAARGCVY